MVLDQLALCSTQSIENETKDRIFEIEVSMMAHHLPSFAQ
jgi:hypothetical protein